MEQQFLKYFEKKFENYKIARFERKQKRNSIT